MKKAKAKRSEALVPAESRVGNKYGAFSLANSVFGGALRLSNETLFWAYSNHGDVYQAVHQIKKNVGSEGYDWLTWNEKKVIENSDTQFMDEVMNGKQSWRRTKDQLIRDYEVAGNGYLEVVRNDAGKAIGLLPLDPRTMAVICDSHGTVLAYVQRTPYGAMVKFDPMDVIHFKKDTDPQNESFGFSPIQTILYRIRIDIAAEITTHSFFKKHATPAVMYITENDLKGDELQALIDQIDQNFSGPENAGKSGVLKGVKDIKTLTMNYKDMQFIEITQISTEKIASAFGVPQFMMGYTSTVNRANGVEQTKNFIETTIHPIEADIAETISQYLPIRCGINAQYAMKFRPHIWYDEGMLEERARAEYSMGLLTPEQYKKKTHQDLMPEDMLNPNFKRHIVIGGSSAVLLDDIGAETVEEPSEEELVNTEKLLTKLNGEVKQGFREAQ